VLKQLFSQHLKTLIWTNLFRGNFESLYITSSKNFSPPSCESKGFPSVALHEKQGLYLLCYFRNKLLRKLDSEICDSQSGVADDSSLLRYDAVSWEQWLPTFRRVVTPSCSGSSNPR
jgi:hypothetical protein